MKQKIAIISALLHRPKVLVLDEALNGLDPRSAKLVKDLLRNLANEGVSVLFSTHVLEIAEALCDHVAIMYQGSILANGTISDLRSQAGPPRLHARGGLPEDHGHRRARRDGEGAQSS